MIKKITIGNILDSKCETLVNTVNCVGIMGKGIALEFKNKFPEMYRNYKKKCENNLVKIGEPYLYQDLFHQNIINFPTKEHWRSISKIKRIEDGLKYLSKNYKSWGITSIAIPPLGCGNGQLDWKDVGPLIYQYIEPLEIIAELYAPIGTPQKMLSIEFLSKRNTNRRTFPNTQDYSLNEAWLILAEIILLIKKQNFHIPIGRTVFQKIGYVATINGLPTHLDYQRSSFGPFSKKLKKVITILSNNGILYEENKGPLFEYQIGPNYEKFRKKHKSLINRYEYIIDKTVDLFSRIYSTQQAEIIATIIFSYNQLVRKSGGKMISEIEVFKEISEWKKKRRPPLDDTKVASAIRNLALLKWIDVSLSDAIPIADEFVY